ncbi:hypothetical protein [Bacillus sonorensis]|uniref:hypothetical protein n=1 Tax=Bacillus sonorensis TaxID=119858 RepID=UPI000497857A|nr:hypothetical protein [Bacillus sonorensis]MCF7618520.1 hypothetical protein [Bacillus sonorensis]MCY8034189.1 hypothetical protein [Bacillus sonorensis]MCY8272827.1 hypothetical protein [Bacillus sonorensis]MCY8564328.1 hypothetical protein [Bacillus sonorensis]MCY8607248.1 hypothetical protein [Bacillus sonorensis]
MELKAIFDTHNDKEYESVLKNLREKYGRGKFNTLQIDDFCENYHIENCYAANVYTGKLKKDMDISELELSMVCDNGYNYRWDNSIDKENTRDFNICWSNCRGNVCW